jgi:hypothetical protein
MAQEQGSSDFVKYGTPITLEPNFTEVILPLFLYAVIRSVFLHLKISWNPVCAICSCVGGHAECIAYTSLMTSKPL